MAFASPTSAKAVSATSEGKTKNKNAKKDNKESLAPQSESSIKDKAAADEEEARLEREARSIAIEKAYVHDVYEQMSKYVSDSRVRAWPQVKQFLEELEFGSLVCDVGCGRGKYLDINPSVYTIGSDRCRSLAQICREKDHEILHCDNLSLPFRDESLDAVLSIAVIHHVATAERRVRAIKELSRVLRVGGRLMISVWAMEQRHRKFESQDVLIPWHKPPPSPSVERLATMSGGASAISTCTTSEDDITHYHAYSQPSDSGEWYHNQRGSRRKNRHKGRSIDTSNIATESAGFLAGQSSSDLSSPNESCYSFVRRAIQKFSTTKRHPSGMIEDETSSSRFPWFSFEQMYHQAAGGGLNLPPLDDEGRDRFFCNDSEDSSESVGDLPIELRHLESQEEKVEKSPSVPSSTILSCNITTKKNPLLANTGLSKMSKSLDYINKKTTMQNSQTHVLERANTYDTHTLSLGSVVKSAESDLQQNEDALENMNNETNKPSQSEGLIQDLRKTLSSSLRSFDISFKSGSLSSLSSGKSVVSNYSIKSDSGIGLLSKRKTTNSRQRTWDSEPHLESTPLKVRMRAFSERDPSSTMSRTTTSSSSSTSSLLSSCGVTATSSSVPSGLPMVSISPSLEKTKVMECKLMKAIKEVNESDLSENTTPVNSPGPLHILSQGTSSVSPKILKKPVLIKQKPSFYFPDTSKEDYIIEPSKSADYDSDITPRVVSMEEEEELEKKDIKRDPPKQVSFEDIKQEVKSMPLLKNQPSLLALPSKGILKQASLNDEFLSGDRAEANLEVRKNSLFKQFSLPDDNFKPRSLKDSVVALAKGNNKRFENFKKSLLRGDSELLKPSSASASPINVNPFSTSTQSKNEPILESKSQPASPRYRSESGSSTTIRRGFVRIFSNWSSTTTPLSGEEKRGASVNYSVDDPSFTLKKGVTIQPLDVRGRDIHSLDSATRRSLFQRRTHRSGASPLSPQQIEALTKENVENLSPTLRRCCLDCTGGDLVVVERERKLSRGDNASDSSSKDGSIQSDTSLDSEDSCVSVIFIPPTSDSSIVKKQRSTSNSSESSESVPSGRVSPLSPGGTKIGSPVKGNGKLAKFKSDSGIEGKEAIFIVEQSRTLEKIDERHTESESEAEKDILMEKKEENGKELTKSDEFLKLEQKESGNKPWQEDKKEENEQTTSVPQFIPHLEKKSFEMEDIPDENPIKCHPKNLASLPRLGFKRGSVQTSSLKNRAKFDYPIVRHHPLFAKQPKTGSNFSSLLAGENVRIIRQRGKTKLHCFEIFNPETDDLDSDNESSTSSTSTSQDSNESVESVVSARVEDTSENRQNSEQKPPTVIVTQEDTDKTTESSDKESTTLEEEVEEERKDDTEEGEEEALKILTQSSIDEDDCRSKDDSSTDCSEMSSELIERSERRRQSLQSLLDENLVVLNSIGVAAPTPEYLSRREKALAKFENQNKLDICFESTEELQESGDWTASTTITQLSKKLLPAFKSLPKKPLLLKAASLDNSNKTSKSLSPSWITRSVDLESEEALIKQPMSEQCTRKKPPMTRQTSAQSDSSVGESRMKLDTRSRPESSSSILSCCSSEGSSSDVSGRISKTPSPSRSQVEVIKKPVPQPRPLQGKRSWMRSTSMIVEGKKSEVSSAVRSRRVSGSAALTGIVDDDIMAQTESLLKDDGTTSASKLSELDPRYEKGGSVISDSESMCSFPYRRLDRQKFRTNRDDSMESTSTSAKSSVQYSDTSSLLSHRFSTISISSNVSSDVSFGNTSIVSGSSCYLASMSSADFDDRPGLVSSFSLSEAEENEYLQSIERERAAGRSGMNISRAKSVFRRKDNAFNSGSVGGSSSLRTKSEEEECSSPSTRLRLPTETSIETSIENPAYAEAQENFEEELFRSFGKDPEGDDDVMLPPHTSSTPTTVPTTTSSMLPLSGASSQESLHSDPSLQTQHRYYHVFREGELDHLINSYVENLHIINSYYDHSNWCIVAEKVNVWTI